MNSDELRIQKYKESLKSAWGYNDYNDWPIKFNSIMHLFLKDFTSEFLDEINSIKEIGVGDEIIMESFGNPARIYRLINPLIYGMKLMRYDLLEQRTKVAYLLKLVENMKAGTAYNEDGNNIILNKCELNNVLKNVHFISCRQNEAEELHRMFGLLWAYTEAIFFRAHDVTKEIHGLYDIEGSKSKLLIREYMNLSPQELWQNTPLLNCSKITIYTVYNDQLDVSIDAYNHLFFKKGNYINDLFKYAIVCDGVEISIETLKTFAGKMLDTIRVIHEWAAKADMGEKVCRYADIYWYRKKALCDILGKEAGVPPIVYQNILNGSPDGRWKNNLSDRQIDQLISLLI